MTDEGVEIEYKSPSPEAGVTDVSTLIARKLGSEPTDVGRFDSGYANAVYYARLADNRDVVAKVSPASSGWNQFEQEAWAYTQCKAVGVPTPEVYVCSPDHGDPSFPEAHILMSRLPGISGDLAKFTPEQKLFIVRSVGHNLSLMHSIAIPGFGHMDKQKDDSFRGKHSTMWEHIQHELHESWNVKKALELGLTSPEQAAELNALFEANRNILDIEQGYLAHGDLSLSMKNVMVQDGELVGIMDMEGVTSTDPVYDFAYFDFWSDNPEHFQTLQEGYDDKSLFDENFAQKLELHKILIGHNLLAYFHGRNEPGSVQLVKDKIAKAKSRLESLTQAEQ